MPAHYAVSDAVIVVVAMSAAAALFRARLMLQAFAMACFGVAAFIGVARFGSGWQVELAMLHAGASQLLGLAGAAALAASGFPHIVGKRGLLLAILCLIAAGAVFIFAKPLTAPLFILMLTLALCAALLQAVRTGSGGLRSAGLALLLVNALVIRRAPWLSEGVAWHAYHLLIALGLAIIAVGMRRKLL